MLPLAVTQYCRAVLLLPDVNVKEQVLVARALWGAACPALTWDAKASCGLAAWDGCGEPAKLAEQSASMVTASIIFFIRVLLDFFAGLKR
jgi:hypothetical protein